MVLQSSSERDQERPKSIYINICGQYSISRQGTTKHLYKYGMQVARVSKMSFYLMPKNITLERVTLY